MAGAATSGIGWQIKQVIIREINSGTGIAQAVDTEGTHIDVRTGAQRTGITPRPGQTWLIDRELGMWTLMAFLPTAAAPGPTAGRAVLVAGTVVVASTAVTDVSDIYLTSQVDGGTPGWLRISGRSPGTSFTIRSSSNADTSTVAWRMTEPG